MSNKENQLSEAIEAALDKKAQDAVVIELGEICSFTDYFLICTGTSTRQNQSIAENIEETLKEKRAFARCTSKDNRKANGYYSTMSILWCTFFRRGHVSFTISNACGAPGSDGTRTNS